MDESTDDAQPLLSMVYVLPRQYLSNLHAWARNPGKHERPGAIILEHFFCQHDLLAENPVATLQSSAVEVAGELNP